MGCRDYVNFKYVIAEFCTIIILLLGITACAVPWYYVSFDQTGVIHQHSLEYLVHMDTTYSNKGDDSCTYGSPDCLTDAIKSMYSAILAFCIIAVVFTFALCIMFCMLSVSFLSINNCVRNVLRVAVIVMAVLILIFILLTWTILFDHMRAYRDDIHDSDDYCDNLKSKEDGGPNCLFVGSTHEASGSNLPNTDVEWGPHAGWVIQLINTLFVLPVLALAIIGCISKSGKIQNENDYQLFQKE